MSATRNAAHRAIAAVPTDGTPDKNPSVGFYVGTAGNVKVMDITGAITTFTNVPAGQIVPLRTKQIFLTGTTAAGIILLYPGA